MEQKLSKHNQNLVYNRISCEDHSSQLILQKLMIKI